MYRKNLDGAFLGAASTPSSSNVLVTATEQPWKHEANVVSVKSGFGSSGCKVGTDAETKTRDAEAEFTNNGVLWSTNSWGNYPATIVGSQSDASTPYSITAQLDGGTGFEVWRAFDGLTASAWNPSPNANNFIRIDFGAAVIVSSFRIYTWNIGITFDLHGSNDGTNWGSSLFSQASGLSTNAWSGTLTISSPAAYRYYRIMDKTSSQLQIKEIEFNTSAGTFDTTELVTGTHSFSPYTLKCYTTSAMGTELVDGEVTVSYRTVIGGVTTDYGAQTTLTAFRALSPSLFADCTSLKLRFQLVGANTMGACTIETASSSVITTKAGSVTIDVNGSTVYQVQTDGDLIAADITADDISLTGSVDQDREATTVKSQTKSDNYTMQDSDSGYVTYVDTDAKTMTLPATAVNRVFTFMNAGADAAVALTISPNASDKIMGVGLTAADDKDLVNTKATAKKGDYVTLVGDGVDGWFVTAMKGTWARES